MHRYPKMLDLYDYNCTSWHPCSTSSSATTIPSLETFACVCPREEMIALIKLLCLFRILGDRDREKDLSLRGQYGTKSQIFLYTMYVWNWEVVLNVPIILLYRMHVKILRGICEGNGQN